MSPDSQADAVVEASIAAVVVSHRSAATIDDCLRRLRSAQGVAEIRVVDNASDDDTLAIVQRQALEDPRLRFIANPDNPGFAVACNQGAHDSASPWLAFVNPDCLVGIDTLHRLLAHAVAARPQAAGEVLLGADLVDEAGVRDGAARRRDPDFAAMLSRAAARRLDIAHDAQRTLQPVDAISGAMMLMPRSLFERIDGFDTGYRLHAEDLDLCRRAREAGALVAVANDVSVVHLRGVSGRSRPLFVEWHKHRGLARYFRRFEAGRRGVLTRWTVYVSIWARWPFASWRAWLQARD